MNKLSDIAEEIRTQDNLATNQPIFILFDQIHQVAEDGYGDEYVYVDDGDEIGDSKESLIDYFKNMEWFPVNPDALAEETIVDVIKKHRSDFRRFHVHVVREFRQAFFTRKSAEQFLEANHHHFRNPLIWCDTLYRNYEMQAVRDALINNRFSNGGD